MKTRIMKDESLNALSMFYLGMVAGSKLKNELELDSNFAVFGDQAGIARVIASSEDDMKVIAAIAGHVGHTLDGSGSIEDSVLGAIKTDCTLRAIRKLAGHVNLHGEGALDSDSMKTLHQLLTEHLEQGA